MRRSKTRPVLVVHGGAGSGVPKKNMEAVFRDSMRKIVEEGYERLLAGESALDVVTFTNKLLEDDPIYNAGRGSKIQSDGKIRMSASVMDGATSRFSGVVNVQGLRHPVELARRLNEKDCRTLAGKGAARQAREWGLEFRSAMTPRRKQEFLDAKKGKTGTVGAVALDVKGRLAAATSTGGRGMEWPERVSDSPTVAGNYATKLVALSATGIGEQIVDFALCAKVATRVEDGLSVEEAMKKSFNEAKRRDYQFGAIALQKNGHFAALTTTPFMIWGAKSASGLVLFT